MRFNWTEKELLLAAELVFDNSWKPLDDSSMLVIELSNFLREFAHRNGYAIDSKYRSPSSVALKTRNIASRHPDWKGSPSNSGKSDLVAVMRFIDDPLSAKEECLRIWSSFSEFAIEEGPLQSLPQFESLSVLEGRLLEVKSSRRERNPVLRKAKLDSMKASEAGVCCEVCGFNFEQKYGERGLDYIEVHHSNPLHVSGEVVSSLGDLIGLCANCHRMIHRGKWITPNQLSQLIRLDQK